MSRILITGVLGAVGSRLAQVLRGRDHVVSGCDIRQTALPDYERCDVAEYRQLESTLKRSRPEYVYHAAAEFGRVNGEENYESLWRTNVIGTKHLLRLQEDLGFRVILFSSSEVYGDWDSLMTEEVLDKYPIRQLNDYAITKWVNELQVRNSADRFGTQTVRVRLFNTYGPGEFYTPYRSVICLFVYRALHDMPYDVYVGHRRTNTYIEDCVPTLANIVDNFKPGEVYNIASDDYQDIRAISDMVLRHTGKDDRLVSYREFEPHNTRDKLASAIKAQQDLGHQTVVSLDEGIRRTVEWQRTVYAVGEDGRPGGATMTSA